MPNFWKKGLGTEYAGGTYIDPAGLFAEGGMFGPKKEPDMSAQNDFIRQLTDQLQQMKPLREQQLGMFGDVMSGKFDPTTSAMFSPIFSSAKSATEDQYNLARENIIGGTARGGAQTGALGDVELARAGTMSSLPAQISQGIIRDMMNKAYGSIFPGGDTAGTAMSGFNSVGAQQAQFAALQQQQNSSNMQGLGSIIALLAA